MNVKMVEFGFFFLSLAVVGNIAIKCNYTNLHDFVVQMTGKTSTEYLGHIDDYSGTWGTKATIQYNVNLHFFPSFSSFSSSSFVLGLLTLFLGIRYSCQHD